MEFKRGNDLNEIKNINFNNNDKKESGIKNKELISKLNLIKKTVRQSNKIIKYNIGDFVKLKDLDFTIGKIIKKEKNI